MTDASHPDSVPVPPTGRSSTPAATLALALLAGLAAWLGVSLVAAARFAEPVLHPRDFVWKSPTGDPQQIEVSRPLDLPYSMRDFDWHMTVELAEDSELDIIARKVEPRVRRLPNGASDLIPFHGRFAVLRLTTAPESEDSVGWRASEAALFDAQPVDAAPLDGGRLGGGLRLRPGTPASVWIRGRGHQVFANVAGRELPAFDCVDGHGDFALVARVKPSEDGTRRPCLMHHLKILNHSASSPNAVLRGQLWATAIALLSALGVGWPRRSGWWRAATGLVAIVVVAGVCGRILLAGLVPWAEPSQGTLVLGGLLGLPIAWFAWLAPRSLGRGMVAGVVALLGSLAMAEWVVRGEASRLVSFEDSRLTEFFGPDSATAPFDALAMRLRSKLRVQTLETDGQPILYFGGELLLEAGASPFVDYANGIQYAGERTTLDVRRATRRKFDTVLVPTQMATAAQQWRLWRRFYSEFPEPAAFVFGISPAEELGGIRAEPISTRSSLRLLDLWRATAREPVQPAAPAEVVATLRAATKWFDDREIPVCWAGHEAISPPYRDAIQRAAGELGVVFEPRFVGGNEQPHVDRIVRELTERLRR